MNIVEKLKAKLIKEIEKKYAGNDATIYTNALNIIEAGVSEGANQLGLGPELQDAKIIIEVKDGVPHLQMIAWDADLDEDEDEIMPEDEDEEESNEEFNGYSTPTRIKWDDLGIQLLVDVYND